MRTGVLLPHALAAGSSHDLVAWARTAEDLGFGALGIRGRITHDSLEPLVALSLLAASTRRIELFLHLPTMRRAQPLILTRQLAGLDRASRRRLILAAGGAVNDMWAFAGRSGHRSCLAVVHVRRTEGAELDAVRDALDALERAGADDVLLEPASADIRELEQLANLGALALV
jgi:alkanesulfonate monooxygenase SsuD/methylene tetrahydromethanopterin reductase-like flavin-dependent oxidoreductase (luciferase family)